MEKRSQFKQGRMSVNYQDQLENQRSRSRDKDHFQQRQQPVDFIQKQNYNNQIQVQEENGQLNQNKFNSQNIIQQNKNLEQEENKSSFNYSSIDFDFQEKMKLRQLLKMHKSYQNEVLKQYINFKKERDPEFSKKSKKVQVVNTFKKITEKVHLYLNDQIGRKQFEQRNWDQVKQIQQNPQREKLMTHIHFLNSNCEEKIIQNVLYLGGAKTIHLHYLIQLFPLYNFLVLDTRDFILQKEQNRLQIHKLTSLDQKEIQNQIEKEFGASPFYCIFEIEDMLEKKVESNKQGVQNYLDQQVEILKLIKPKMSLIDFRTNYYEGIIQFIQAPKGVIMIPPWRKRNSNKTRLIVGDKIEIIDYDVKKYDEQMFFINDQLRRQPDYCFNPLKVAGLRDDFDSIVDLVIQFQFLYKNHLKFHGVGFGIRIHKFNREIMTIFKSINNILPEQNNLNNQKSKKIFPKEKTVLQEIQNNPDFNQINQNQNQKNDSIYNQRIEGKQYMLQIENDDENENEEICNDKFSSNYKENYTI